ncbi:hypothetical protein PoB_002757600 [Plakobranchus ocellatus]|uniref:Uncharacterized protein n=1 Tax=Plakobranchus ocellatus TaxID=259542 RepID=A0AAV3ZYS8_9GAST|nr:hypothetical protein PoB_002757600 [Plakobranchus ocellatus]
MLVLRIVNLVRIDSHSGLPRTPASSCYIFEIPSCHDLKALALHLYQAKRIDIHIHKQPGGYRCFSLQGRGGHRHADGGKKIASILYHLTSLKPLVIKLFGPCRLLVGSDQLETGPCRSQGEVASICAIDFKRTESKNQEEKEKGGGGDDEEGKVE